MEDFKFLAHKPYDMLPDDKEAVIIKTKLMQYKTVIWVAKEEKFCEFVALLPDKFEIVKFGLSDVQWWVNAADLPDNINLDNISCED